MKILYLSGAPDLPERHLIDGLRRKGLQVQVGCEPGCAQGIALRENGVEVFELFCRSRFDLRAIARIRSEIRSFQPTVVHAFTARALCCAVIASLGKGVPLVGYRGTMGNVSRFDPSSWLSYLNPKVRAISCVSNAVRDDLLRLRPDPKTVIRIYKGHDLSWYDGIVPADRRALSIGEHDVVIVCTANMRPLKGIDVLIRAFAHLPQQIPTHLVLVGEMRDPSLVRIVDDLNLGARVHFTGYQPAAIPYTAMGDIFVMPSLRREGFPKAVIEAMACGKPVVVSDVGGMPEMVDPGMSGFVVPPDDPAALADALATLVNDPSRRCQMGARGRMILKERFPIERTIEETEALYRRLAEGASRRSLL